MDFVRPLDVTNASLVAGRGHYETVVAAVREARRSIWIATANLKELMVEDASLTPGLRRTMRARYKSVLQVFDELAARGVEIRILHASMPSRAFRDRFDRLPRLVRGGIEMRMCPRVHFKAVVVDARTLYLGSANWTGAGLGAKGAGRRNFELGLVTSDEALIDEVQAVFEHLWRGKPCASCKLRDTCEMPLDAQRRSVIDEVG